MHNNLLDHANQVISDLGLDYYYPEGDDPNERYEHVYSTCKIALSRLQAQLNLRLVEVSPLNGAQRRALLLDHMEAAERISDVMDRGYTICRQIDAEEHMFAMLKIEHDEIKRRCESKRRVLAAKTSKAKVVAVSEKLKLQLAEKHAEQKGVQQ